MIPDPVACCTDMLDYTGDGQEFAAGMAAESFPSDRKAQFAVLRDLEAIGEATKRVRVRAMSVHDWTRAHPFYIAVDESVVACLDQARTGAFPVCDLPNDELTK